MSFFAALKQSLVGRELPSLHYDENNTALSQNASVAPLFSLGVRAPLTCSGFDAHARLLALASSDGSLCVAGKDFLFALPRAPGTQPPASFVMFFMHMLVAICGTRAEVYNLVTRSLLCVRELPERVTAAHGVYHLRLVFLGGERGSVHVLNLDKDVFVSHARVTAASVGAKPRDIVTVLQLHPEDENILLIGHSRASLVEWSLRDSSVLSRFAGHPDDDLRCACYKRDGKMIVCGYGSGAISIYLRTEPTKPTKTYFGNAGNRAVKHLAWSEVGGNNIIVATGCTAHDSFEGATLLLGNPLNRTTAVAAAQPIGSFFLDPSPYYCEVEPPAFAIVTALGRVLAFDCTTLKEIPVPLTCKESVCASCCVTNVPWAFVQSLKQSMAATGSKGCAVWDALGGAIPNPVEIPEDQRQGSAEVLVFKFFDGGRIQVSWITDRLGYAREEIIGHISSLRFGQDAVDKPLPGPVVGCFFDLPCRTLCFWTATELFLIRFCEEQGRTLKYAERSADFNGVIVDESASVHGTWSVIVHASEFKCINQVTTTRDGFVWALVNDATLTCWFAETEIGNFDLELDKKDEQEVPASFFVYNDESVLIPAEDALHHKDAEHKEAPEQGLTKVIVLSKQRKYAWVIELHNTDARSKRVPLTKHLGPLAHGAFVFGAMLDAAASSKGKCLEYMLLVTSRCIVTARFSLQHLIMEESACYEAENGTEFVDAVLMTKAAGTASPLLSVVCAKNDHSASHVLMFPLFDVSAGPKLGESVIYESTEENGLRRNLLGGSGRYVVQLSSDGLLLQQSSFGHVSLLAMTANSNPILLSPPETVKGPSLFTNEKLKENPVKKGFFASLFSSSGSIAEVFSERMPDRSPARGSPAAKASEQQAKVGEVKNVMEENIRKLNERGEHISEVEQRTHELQDASATFAANIAKLREKQKNSLFGGW